MLNVISRMLIKHIYLLIGYEIRSIVKRLQIISRNVFLEMFLRNV